MNDPKQIFAPAIAAFPSFAADINALIAKITIAQTPAPTPTPTPVPVVVVGPTPFPVTGDLAAAIAKGGDLLLAPASYSLPVGKAKNTLPLNLKGPPGCRIVFQQVPGVSTGIEQRAALEISGITFASNRPLATAGKAKVNINVVRSYAQGLNLHDCTAGDIDNLVFFEDNSGGIVRACKNTDRTIRGDFIFVAGANNVLLDNLQCPGSHNEHVVRIDSPNAHDITIQNCNLANWNGKETITGRTVGGDKAKNIVGLLVVNCDLNNWARLGQVAPDGSPPPLLSVGYASFTGNRFHTRAYFEIAEGVTAMVNINVFDDYAAYCALHIQFPNVNVTGSGNRLNLIPGQVSNHDTQMLFGPRGKNDVAEIGFVP